MMYDARALQPTDLYNSVSRVYVKRKINSRSLCANITFLAFSHIIYGIRVTMNVLCRDSEIVYDRHRCAENKTPNILPSSMSG